MYIRGKDLISGVYTEGIFLLMARDKNGFEPV